MLGVILKKFQNFKTVKVLTFDLIHDLPEFQTWEDPISSEILKVGTNNILGKHLLGKHQVLSK